MQRSVFQLRKLWSLFLVGLLAALVGGAQAKQLRTAEKGDHEQRKLQTQFQLPFDITWRIEIGNGQSDREPTTGEHQGVVQATIGWFEENIANIYGDAAGLEFVDFQANLDTAGTSWTPGASEYPHIININCVAIWEATTFNAVPDNREFLLTLNDQASVRDFIVSYLLSSGPDNSIYRFSQRVAYATSTTTPAGPLTPTLAPVATPAPGPTNSFPAAFVIPFTLTFAIGMGTNFPDYRQPITQEWSGLQAAAEQWILDSLGTVYSGETSFAISDVTSTVVSTGYDETPGELYPYTMILDAAAIYRAAALSNIPNLVDFFATLRSDQISLLDFVEGYLQTNIQPPDSIFQQATVAQYTSDQNGPRLPASATTPPGTTAAPGPPTPAPVRSTPAPVSPNALLSTVYTRSNWTYTIGEEFGVQDRPSTQAEFEGLADSTHEWLTRIFNEYYNVNNQDQNLPRFVGLESALVDGIYRPNNPRPHLMIFNYNITFSLDPDDPTEVVPFIDDIFNVIEEADLNQYVFLYAHTSEPIESSVFHGVNSVNWVYDLSDEYTYVPRPTRPPTGGGGGAGGDGGPLAGSTGVNRNQLTNAQSNSVSLLIEYRLVDPATGRAPTEEEWDGLLEATRNFWTQTLAEEYSATSATNFVMIDMKWRHDSTEYTPGANFPYVGRLDMAVLFTEGSAMQTDEEMRSRMSGLIPNSNYILTYVRTARPPSNIFRDTLEIQWDF